MCVRCMLFAWCISLVHSGDFPRCLSVRLSGLLLSLTMWILECDSSCRFGCRNSFWCGFMKNTDRHIGINFPNIFAEFIFWRSDIWEHNQLEFNEICIELRSFFFYFFCDTQHANCLWNCMTKLANGKFNMLRIISLNFWVTKVMST